MNNIPIKQLAWLGGAVLVLLGIFLLVEINHVWSTAATTNTVSFNGQGKVSAKPDVAMISATVLTQSPNSRTAQDQNTQRSDAVTNFLKAQGIDEKDIKTTGYNIYPQYRYDGGPGTITGYQVTQSFQIKLRELDKISALLSGLVSAGANQVDNLGLQIENPEQLRKEAREKAITDAKKKAGELEDQINIKLGRLVNFSENTGGGYPIPMYDRATVGVGGGGPTISPGENEIIVDVSLTYQIK